MRSGRAAIWLAVCLGFGSAAYRARAAFVVAPNLYASSDAPEGTVYPFRGASGGDATLQWVLPAADFAAVTPGNLLTGIGFRLDSSASGISTEINFTQWNLQLSTVNNPTLSLSATFTANLGANNLTVRSGPLSIPPNAFPIAPSPRGFYEIPFTTPFAYNGGELVVTLRHTGHGGDQGLVTNDGVATGPLGNTVGSQFSSTTGSVNFFNFPVARFTVTPEPSGTALAAICLLAVVVRRRARRPLGVHVLTLVR